ERTNSLVHYTTLFRSGLIEGDFGDWTGAELAELQKLPEWQTVQNRPDEFRFPNGESFAEMQQRMHDTLTRLRDAHPGGTVVCFRSEEHTSELQSRFDL